MAQKIRRPALYCLLYTIYTVFCRSAPCIHLDETRTSPPYYLLLTTDYLLHSTRRKQGAYLISILTTLNSTKAGRLLYTLYLYTFYDTPRQKQGAYFMLYTLYITPRRKQGAYFILYTYYSQLDESRAPYLCFILTTVNSTKAGRLLNVLYLLQST